MQGVHPVHETTKDFFKNFILNLVPGKKIRSQSYYKEQVKKNFSTKKKLLKKLLAETPWVCTTADCWSSRRRQFLGVTVHWLDNELMRKSACLAIKPVYGTCDYNSIATILEAIYEDFDITGKIIATITDNGSNFEKAFRVYGVDVNVLFPSRDFNGYEESNASAVSGTKRTYLGTFCTSAKSSDSGSRLAKNHSDHLRNVDGCEIEDMLEDFSSDFSESEPEEDDNSDSDPEAETNEQSTSAGSVQTNLKRVRIFNDDEEPETFIPLTEMLQSSVNISTMFNLPPHRRCACHTLNLIAKEDIAKRSDIGLLSIKTGVEAKIKQITKRQRKSPKASQKINEVLGGLFVQPNSTRWNSWFNAHKRIALFLTKKRTELRELFQHFKIPFFRPIEEEFIKEFVRVMRPLAEALDVLQADINVSTAHLLPTLNILLNEMTNLETSGLKVCKNMPKIITNSINKRFAGYFEDEQLVIASILHPKFKVWWLHENERSCYIKRLTELCQLLENQDNDSENCVQ